MKSNNTHMQKIQENKTQRHIHINSLCNIEYLVPSWSRQTPSLPPLRSLRHPMHCLSIQPRGRALRAVSRRARPLHRFRPLHPLYNPPMPCTAIPSRFAVLFRELRFAIPGDLLPPGNRRLPLHHYLRLADLAGLSPRRSGRPEPPVRLTPHRVIRHSPRLGWVDKTLGEWRGWWLGWWGSMGLRLAAMGK